MSNYSWYIALSSSVKQQFEIFCVVWRTWTSTHNFQYYHNLFNIWNKFQLINNSCFYFELYALLIIHSSTLDDLTWDFSSKPPNQSELEHLDTCLPNLAIVFLLSHEIDNSATFCGDEVLLLSHSCPQRLDFWRPTPSNFLPPGVRLVEAHSLLSTQECLQWPWVKAHSLLSIHCLHLLGL